MPPKAKGKRKYETTKPLSGLDIDALLGTQPKRAKISAENAIPEFMRALAVAEEVSEIQDAAQQMGDIVGQLIADSFGDSNYARATENLGVLRQGIVDLEEPGVYNDIIRDLKKKILSGELGGDRREMWWKIRTSRLGLIDQATSEVSNVTSEDANEVCLFFRDAHARCFIANMFAVPEIKMTGYIAGVCLRLSGSGISCRFQSNPSQPPIKPKPLSSFPRASNVYQ